MLQSGARSFQEYHHEREILLIDKFGAYRRGFQPRTPVCGNIIPGLGAHRLHYWSTELKDTPIGPIGLAASERGLVRISLYGAEGLYRDNHFAPRSRSAGPFFEAARPAPSFLVGGAAQVKEYLLGKRRAFDLPLDLDGFTPLGLQILAACRAIPFGEICTYQQLAASVGRPGAARFVGNMMARNPLPLVIPCHRVVGSDGRLHGFGAPGGLVTKASLLTLEGHSIHNLVLSLTHA
jgi:methylated-DNA-[protein]-cysteine S-methyltransferase